MYLTIEALTLIFFFLFIILLIGVELMLSMLGKTFSRQHFEIVFLFFSRKQDLTFHANCLDNLHEMSSPVFWGK